ncbi:MAG TPA: 4-hydroxythreonine-4-phosphate dehydrogenase PdxA, partial [Ilumatobacteraceae bacterium]|nr:4-hydroxythreonine-4-phosphate dehydrogenase PdxA [Ilumatobacteraceae bacterium]
MNTTPIVAITMGDPFGVGPEVVVKALARDDVRSLCRPVVIGDVARLQRAAELCGVTVQIENVSDGPLTPAAVAVWPGRIPVIEVGRVPADLAWGQVSPAGGDAAYRYVERAATLAMAGDVQAICTAPLNKEALHAAGHIYPGHTELLAHLTGTDEVSMMLEAPGLRVVHVTTHIGLIDAIARIEPGLVERTIRRADETLRRAGIVAPRFAVCGINPHAGEQGLFGHG